MGRGGKERCGPLGLGFTGAWEVMGIVGLSYGQVAILLILGLRRRELEEVEGALGPARQPGGVQRYMFKLGGFFALGFRCLW